MLKKIFPILLIALLLILGLSGEVSCYRRQKMMRSPSNRMEVETGASTKCGPCLTPEPEVLPPHKGPAPVLTLPKEGPDKCMESAPNVSPKETPPPCSGECPETSANKPRKLRRLGAAPGLPPPIEIALPIEPPAPVTEAPVPTEPEAIAPEPEAIAVLEPVPEPEPSDFDVREEAPNEVLLWMARTGHADGVLTLTRDGLSERDLSEAFLAAAEYGRDEVLKELSKDWNISPATYVRALEAAAENGRLNIIRVLLAIPEVKISSSECGQAIVKAVQHGQKRHMEMARSAIVQELLESQSRISEADRGMAVVFAAQNDYPNIVQRLLSDGSISNEDYVEALGVASKRGHGKVVEELLKFKSNR